MPVTLEGSCRCGAVSFSLESHTPHPYQLCYCSICRKVGGSGDAINIMGDHGTLKVEGAEAIGAFRAPIEEGDGSYLGPAQRHFCRRCGTMLWVYDEDWPELVHPFASAIDTELPVPPERVHMMLDFKPDWVPVAAGPDDKLYDRYSEQSIEDWHRSRGLWVE
jgi:hypothetical protein